MKEESKDYTVDMDEILDALNEEALIEDPHKGKKKCFIRLFALLLVITFTALMFNNILAFFNMPSLDFILDSREISKDPEIQSWQQAVVAIRTPNSRGTGFNISSHGTIITNYHIVEGAKNVVVTFSSNGQYNVYEWISFPEIDLAIISLDANALPALSLEKQKTPAIGDEVTIIGNPLGFTRIVNKGEFSGYTRLRDWQIPVLMIKGSIHKGNSGSPVINADGNVIGMVFATAANNQHEDDIIGLAVPISEIIKKLK